MIHRAISCGVVALAAAALLVPTAAADKPSKVPFPSVAVTDQFCPDFQVALSPTADKAVLHLFSSGVGLLTGQLKVEATNVSTGKTITLNIPGPGKLSPDGTTLEARGPWLLFGTAGQLPGSDPGMLLVHGHTTLELGPLGIASITVRGTVQDVCAMLAA